MVTLVAEVAQGFEGKPGQGVHIVLVGVSTGAQMATALRGGEAQPLSTDAFAALADYDRSDDPASHPERWPTLVQTGGA